MNFNVIEGDYACLEDIHDAFCEDYLWSNELSTIEIRKKYGLSFKEFWEFANTVKKEYGFSKRPVKREGRYYYRRKYGWAIQKKVGDALLYFGFVPSEEIAKQVVELCINSEWDINTCSEIVSNWEMYTNGSECLW